MNTNYFPYVTVVVPCHNAENFIDNCLTSLNAQTYQNLQIILVDDNSCDNTFQLLSSYSQAHPKFEVIKSMGNGVSCARNTGIENAKGDYITFVDCDDFVSPHHIELMVCELVKNQADAVVVDFKRVRENRKISKLNFTNIKKYKTESFLKLDALKEYLSQKKFEFSVWNKLYSKKILTNFNVRFLPGCQYNEDSLFNYKFFKHANKTVLAHCTTYFYVQRSNSLVHRPFTESKLDAFMSLNNIIKDAYENLPEIIHHAHIMRVAICCEILFYIKFCKYNNGAVIDKIIGYISTDCKHLKYCKQTHLYRRILIPLVPSVAKVLLCIRRKADGQLLEQFYITEN